MDRDACDVCGHALEPTYFTQGEPYENTVVNVAGCATRCPACNTHGPARIVFAAVRCYAMLVMRDRSHKLLLETISLFGSHTLTAQRLAIRDTQLATYKDGSSKMPPAAWNRLENILLSDIRRLAKPVTFFETEKT